MQAGTLVWAEFGAPLGSEQGGRRPALVISAANHVAATALVCVLPCTTRDRGWLNHVEVDCAGLREPTFAITEQPRTISQERVFGTIGEVSPECLDEALSWVRRWITE